MIFAIIQNQILCDETKYGDGDVCLETTRIFILSTNAGSSSQQTLEKNVEELELEG